MDTNKLIEAIEKLRDSKECWRAAFYNKALLDVIDLIRQADEQVGEAYVQVEDIDVEIAIAEAIQLMPPRITYEEKGVPILDYLKKHGWSVMQLRVRSNG